MFRRKKAINSELESYLQSIGRNWTVRDIAAALELQSAAIRGIQAQVTDVDLRLQNVEREKYQTP